MIAGVLVMAITAVGAVLAVSQGSIVRAIFGLAVALAGIALAFLLLGSPFLAAMEVLIYIGGITVAMAFGVMLSSAGREEPGESPLRRILAGGAAGAFFAGVGFAIWTSELPASMTTDVELWSVEAIGRELLDQFNVVFEILSVVLLVAIIGAITIAGRRGGERGDPTAPEENDA